MSEEIGALKVLDARVFKKPGQWDLHLVIGAFRDWPVPIWHTLLFADAEPSEQEVDATLALMCRNVVGQITQWREPVTTTVEDLQQQAKAKLVDAGDVVWRLTTHK